MNIFCNNNNCNNDNCKNRLNELNKKEIKIVKLKNDKKGYGLIANENIKKNEFIIEYIGEVINEECYIKRTQKYKNNNNKYIIELQNGFYIDATVKGNEARFINHSCNPNTICKKMIHNNDTVITFYCHRDIKKNEEITFNYNYYNYDKNDPCKCMCHSINCNGSYAKNS